MMEKSICHGIGSTSKVLTVAETKASMTLTQYWATECFQVSISISKKINDYKFIGVDEFKLSAMNSVFNRCCLA